MEAVYNFLTARAYTLNAASIRRNLTQTERVLIALAGPPGSGKSTIAANVVQRLNAGSEAGPYAAVLPLDGFHLTQATLEAMPNCVEARARRGVYWTYDAQGVLDLITSLYDSKGDMARTHLAPSFDHAVKDPVENAISIDEKTRLLILEGNWLLYDQEPWASISRLVDETWFVDVDADLALYRIAKRHLESGIEATWQDAINRAKSNDLLNGELVRTNLIAPTLRVESCEELSEMTGR